MSYESKECKCIGDECSHGKEECIGKAFGTMAIWTLSYLEAKENGSAKRDIHIVCAECFWKYDKNIRVNTYRGSN